MKAATTEIKIYEGLKLKALLGHVYQISLLKKKLVIVSWVEQGNILSTDYKLSAVKKYLQEGTWNIVSDDACIVHL